MNIEVAFPDLENIMQKIVAITTNPTLDEKFKNLFIWVHDNRVDFGAHSNEIITALNAQTNVQLDEGESLENERIFLLSAKDINDVLSANKSLKRTKISKVQFELHNNSGGMVPMHLFEEPVDPEILNADKYFQKTSFRITSQPPNKITNEKIARINSQKEFTTVETGLILVYLQALLPTVAKEKRNANNQIVFADDLVYTMVQTYAATMQNNLPEVFKGFKLKNDVAAFLESFIGDVELFNMHKEADNHGRITITFQLENSIAIIDCADMTNAYDMTNFVKMPENAVAVDRKYLQDVLRRMSLSSEPTNVTVKIDSANGTGSLEIRNQSLKQDIPVLHAKGEGEFAFSVRPQTLSALILSHTDMFGDIAFFYLEQGQRKIILGVKDEQGIWATKTTGLSPAKGDFAW